MRKTKILLLTLSLIGLNSCNQKLTCSDFKTGKFYIPATEDLKKYTITSKDSINELSTQRNEEIKKYVVIRKKNTQTEWKDGINNGTPEYEKIEWINDCSYRLKYDGSKTELTQQKNG